MTVAGEYNNAGIVSIQVYSDIPPTPYCFDRRPVHYTDLIKLHRSFDSPTNQSEFPLNPRSTRSDSVYHG